MDPDTDVCQTEQPQISYSVDFIIAEQSSAMGSPILLGRGVASIVTGRLLYLFIILLMASRLHIYLQPIG